MPSDHRRTTTLKNQRVDHGSPVQEPEHLPCPRCDSTNTKFCYYNNYNFSQPRHFCKSCRRYWTQGGTLRDIPVGGGSRKNAKRLRLSTTRVSSGLEYHNILPSVTTNSTTTTGVFTPVVGMGAQYGSGSFTSLLSSAHCQGLFGPEVCGFDPDVGFGVGRMIWPFSGGVGGGNSSGGGGGSTWQLENGYGGGDCFVLPDLAISTPGNAMKIE